MSDLKLRGFAVRAEERMPLPDFAELEDRGRSLRRRRLAAATGVAVACVLAVAGVVVLRDDSPRAVEPVRPPDEAPVGALKYPGAVMETLDSGTYELIPSSESYFPRATITLPDGWNAWQGPNRFDVQDAGDTNEEALGEITWYVGILVLRVDGVSSGLCRDPGSSDEQGSTPESLTRAVRAIPGFRVTETTEPPEKFGYPATHLRLVPDSLPARCEANLFRTDVNGVVGGSTDNALDIWVVDVEGYPVLVESNRSGKVPPAVRHELAAAVDSIEFHFAE